MALWLVVANDLLKEGCHKILKGVSQGSSKKYFPGSRDKFNIEKGARGFQTLQMAIVVSQTLRLPHFNASDGHSCFSSTASATLEHFRWP